MTQEDTAQRRRIDFGQILGRVGIVHVTVVGENAPFEVRRIGSVQQHGLVVVRLNNQVVGLPQVFVGRRSDGSQIGGKGKMQVAVGDEEAYIVAPVVGHLESGNREVSDLEGHLLDDGPVGAVNLVDHAVVKIHAVLDGLGGIDGDSIFFAQCPGRLDVVGMVVGDAQCYNLFKGNAILPQYFFNGAHALTGVDQYAIFFISQIVTVAAASAGQAQKLQAHRIFLLLGVQR